MLQRQFDDPVDHVLEAPRFSQKLVYRGPLPVEHVAAIAPPRLTVLDMDRYQWTVLFAAWLGWGFDIFDSLLFNYVAPTCVPVLLHIPLGTPAAGAATLRWTGILTSLLLIGWAAGGILFGRIADRLGRSRTLLVTMAMYSVGTAACAFAPNIWSLVLFRVIASLGIGGEWVAGAAMVAEIVPEKRRVDAGALLYTAAPMGLFLATFIVFQIQGVYFRGTPEVAWRYVFLSGLIPAFVAIVVRLMIKEPERWKRVAEKARPARISELFTPAYIALTFSGASLAMINLLTWWSVNAFIPTVAVGLANRVSAGASAISCDRAGRAVEGAGDQRVRRRRRDWRPADHSRGEVPRAPQHVHRLLPRRRAVDHGGVRPAAVAGDAALYVLPDRA